MKLGDFGIARQLEYTLEFVRTLIGTPYYLSPEAVEGRPYSQPSDVWSLGVLLYQLAALKLPFQARVLCVWGGEGSVKANRRVQRWVNPSEDNSSQAETKCALHAFAVWGASSSGLARGLVSKGWV
eukprot:4070847-Pleurochrysis_carterae.AAC.1